MKIGSNRTVRSAAIVAASLAAPLLLTACNTGAVLGEREFVHGHQINDETLTLVPVGSSREQAVLALGTPSTTLTQVDGTETLYYISQRKKRAAAFLQPRVVDQRILAVYLADDGTVSRIGNFGLKDGKVFDFVRRVTPTGGRELTFLSQLLGAAGAIANPLGGARRPGS
ncbi:outer membrane protein assembly factor BamE [Pseudahrensia aquimaris]|uniref:Outer membrane protein assembly factor BamE n=1 Tax=Pseudahrensia aquimaris TaxID=744461 RepID=A0ABW3FCI1_9HYPH